MSNFDSAWDSFIHETHKHINKMLEGFRDSFKEKMDEIIEMDELFEPFTFVPNSRLGRFIVCLAMDMKMNKE